MIIFSPNPPLYTTKEALAISGKGRIEKRALFTKEGPVIRGTYYFPRRRF